MKEYLFCTDSIDKKEQKELLINAKDIINETLRSLGDIEIKIRYDACTSTQGENDSFEELVKIWVRIKSNYSLIPDDPGNKIWQCLTGETSLNLRSVLFKDKGDFPIFDFYDRTTKRSFSFYQDNSWREWSEDSSQIQWWIDLLFHNFDDLEFNEPNPSIEKVNWNILKAIIENEMDKIFKEEIKGEVLIGDIFMEKDQNHTDAKTNENTDEGFKTLAWVNSIFHDSINNVDPKIYMPLHLACCISPLSHINILLENGADPNISNEQGITPAYAVAQAKRDDAIAALKLLKSYGANLHTPNNVDGSCSIFPAIEDNRLDIVEYLLANGYNVEFTSKVGKHALDHAHDHAEGITSIMNLLHDYNCPYNRSERLLILGDNSSSYEYIFRFEEFFYDQEFNEDNFSRAFNIIRERLGGLGELDFRIGGCDFYVCNPDNPDYHPHSFYVLFKTHLELRPCKDEDSEWHYWDEEWPYNYLWRSFTTDSYTNLAKALCEAFGKDEVYFIFMDFFNKYHRTVTWSQDEGPHFSEDDYNDGEPKEYLPEIFEEAKQDFEKLPLFSIGD